MAKDPYPDTNHITVVGRLVDNPTLKAVGQDNHVAELRIAVNNPHGATTYIDVQTWGGSAKAVNQYLHQGEQIVASGRLHFDCRRGRLVLASAKSWWSSVGRSRCRFRPRRTACRGCRFRLRACHVSGGYTTRPLAR